MWCVITASGDSHCSPYISCTADLRGTWIIQFFVVLGSFLCFCVLIQLYLGCGTLLVIAALGKKGRILLLIHPVPHGRAAPEATWPLVCCLKRLLHTWLGSKPQILQLVDGCCTWATASPLIIIVCNTNNEMASNYMIFQEEEEKYKENILSKTLRVHLNFICDNKIINCVNLYLTILRWAWMFMDSSGRHLHVRMKDVLQLTACVANGFYCFSSIIFHLTHILPGT